MNGILGLAGSMSFFFALWGQTTPPANNGQTTVPKPKTQVIRLQVRHADPWFVVKMLEGATVQFPELSTLGIPGLLSPPSSGAKPLFPGKFVVNPTDNSILYYPPAE